MTKSPKNFNITTTNENDLKELQKNLLIENELRITESYIINASLKEFFNKEVTDIYKILASYNYMLEQ